MDRYETSTDARNEVCWETGIYDDDCDCESCYHKHECSGYKEEE